VNPVKIGLLGLGTVGAGTLNVLTRNASEITRRAGREIRIVHAAARDVKKPRACPLENIRLSQDPFAVVDDPEIELVDCWLCDCRERLVLICGDQNERACMTPVS